MANVEINGVLQVPEENIPTKIVVDRTPDYWQTPTSTGELNTSMLVKTGAWPSGGSYDFSPTHVYQLNIGPVEVGDVISVHAHNEFTNDAHNGSSYIDVSLLAVIIMSTNSASHYLDSGVYELSEATGPNVGHNIPHHADITRHGAIEITETIKTAVGNNDVYITFEAWAVAPTPGSATVDIGQDYGRMTVFRWRETQDGEIITTVCPAQTGNSGKFLKTNGTSTEWATVDALPAQTGHNGKALVTDGTSAAWQTIGGSLPSQSGNNGKLLGTDGTDASWVSPPSGTLPTQTGNNGKYLTTDGTDAAWTQLVRKGTWTPTIAGATTAGTGTYSVQQARWTRVDDVVMYNIRITVSAHSGSAGQMVITGLPFTAAMFSAANVYQDGLSVGAGKQSGGLTASSSTIVAMYQMNPNGASSSQTVDGVCDLVIGGMYFTNDA